MSNHVSDILIDVFGYEKFNNKGRNFITDYGNRMVSYDHSCIDTGLTHYNTDIYTEYMKHRHELEQKDMKMYNICNNTSYSNFKNILNNTIIYVLFNSNIITSDTTKIESINYDIGFIECLLSFDKQIKKSLSKKNMLPYLNVHHIIFQKVYDIQNLNLPKFESNSAWFIELTLSEPFISKEIHGAIDDIFYQFQYMEIINPINIDINVHTIFVLFFGHQNKMETNFIKRVFDVGKCNNMLLYSTGRDMECIIQMNNKKGPQGYNRISFNILDRFKTYLISFKNSYNLFQENNRLYTVNDTTFCPISPTYVPTSPTYVPTSPTYVPTSPTYVQSIPEKSNLYNNK